MSRFSLRISRKALLALVLLALAALVSGAGLGPTVAQEAEPAPQGQAQLDGMQSPAMADEIAAITAHGPPPDGFLYALQEVNGGANHIYGFRVNGTTGFLSLLPGFPVATGGTGVAQSVSEMLFYDRANQRLFALNDGSDTLSAYKVNRLTGRLTPLPYHNQSLGEGPWFCLTAHPGGSPLVVATTNANQVRSYNVSDTALTQAAGSPYAAEGVHLLVRIQPQRGIRLRRRVPGPGLQRQQQHGAAGGPGRLALFSGHDPGGLCHGRRGPLLCGQLLRRAGPGGDLQQRRLERGDQQPLHLGPVFSCARSGPPGRLLHGGRPKRQPGRRLQHRRLRQRDDPLRGTGSPFNTGQSESHILALNQGGNFLFVANATSRSITRFTVNQSTGALSSASSTPANFVGNSGRITGLAMVAGRPQILVHTDDPSLAAANRLPEQALHGLGLPYYVTYDGNQNSFANRLTTGEWDLAIFMVDNFSVATGILDAMLDYVNRGGRLIAYTWNLSGVSAHPLWAKLGFAYQSSITAENGVNVPVYQWDTAHPIFNLPQDVPSPLDWVSSQALGFIGGQRVQPTAGGAALAGYVSSPTANQAALIVANDGRTIYKAFGDTWHDNSDKDGDNIADAVELWEDLIFYMIRTQTYLPGVLKPCFGGPGENEPNNGPGTAVGSLCSGAVITGSPKNDAGNEEDWFFIDWGGAGTLTVNVTSFPTQAGLFLYRDSTGNLVGSEQNEGDGTYQVQCVGGACGGGGKYLIRLFVPEAAKAGAPNDYQLTATISP
jgi:6-phosphogluconolactonase (cycloisomerase 2 family)